MFDAVAEMLRGMVSPELGELRCRARRYGIKVWFGPEHPAREHYEAQVIGADYAEDATLLALEVGFHAEHPQVAENEAVIDSLRGSEARWRPMLGEEAIVGPFLGRPDCWRRVSETWPDPDLGEPDLAVEIAVRLADYMAALEPVLRDR